MRLLGGLLMAMVLSLVLATAQGMQCHRCKGFGGCSHVFSCSGSATHCVTIATRTPISFTDLPLVTKMCYRGCPEVSSLGLGPHVSVACCQSSLCNHD
ncbi:secreted Ly-6/uPAR domain-containing protein 2 [Fukomys damarensis]|uniref:Secreted Ly-6/uPAR domain-containing protein 2 n=1 Tax=Fukomys damarensis TaxID=885580 RepID=A0A091D3Y0_FUKDA|nr:secreted Ly-6/uPAR domain-containing protein 2 [Fukomys damarensis]KFO26809.1 Secreted Ly-6/uPAR-related protein 2 [Fukomys damarensis]